MPVLAKPRGLPKDVSAVVEDEFIFGDAHTLSYFTARELSEFNYDAPVENRRATRCGDGGCTCEPGEGELTTWREFLGETFMEQVEALGKLGPLDDVRVVFWFDN